MIPSAGLRRSLVARVVVTAVVAGLLVLAVGLALSRTAFQLRAAQRLQVERIAPAQDHAATMLGLFLDQETGLRGYLIGGRSVFLDPYRKAQVRIPATIAALRTETAGDAGAGRPLDQLVASYQRWLAYADGQLDSIASGRLAEARALANSGAGKDLFDDLRVRIAGLETQVNGASQRNQAKVDDLQRRLIVLLAVALTALALLLAGSVVVLLRMIIGPLSRIAAAARGIAEGTAATRLPSGGPAEIRALAGDLEAMRERLSAEVVHTRQAMEALEQHGPAVVALRAALEPTMTEIPGLLVAGRLDPAEGVLAGDWFDLARVDDQSLALVLGDVAGHGPASAVFALRLKHALAAALRTGARPSAALSHVARGLADAGDEMFATVLVAKIDTRSDRIYYANAGHPAALLLARPTDAPEPLEPGEHERVLHAGAGDKLSWIDLPATGPLLSPLVASWSWATAEHDFRPDDTVLAFTDGLVEARNREGEQFGVARVIAVAQQTGVTDPATLLTALAQASDAFTEGTRAQDDRAFICCHRTMTSSSAPAATLA
jgi:serine phosphatase RsbU (regulator of sigma subunit)/CHASE3 domain sensor protein